MNGNFYLLTDWVSWRGGVNNVQRTRVMLLGTGCVKVFTSTVDKSEKYARAWGKKKNITFPESS